MSNQLNQTNPTDISTHFDGDGSESDQDLRLQQLLWEI